MEIISHQEYLGIVEGMSEEDYRKAPGLSSTDLRTIVNKSPAHYKYAEREETAAMALGTAVHMALLETDKFARTYCQKPEGMNFATKEGKAWKEANQDKKILSFDDYEKCRKIYAAAQNNSMAKELLRDTKKELSYFWKDPETGILLKCRLDALKSDGTIVDIKTAEDASISGFRRSMTNYNYKTQAIFYMEGVKHMLNMEQYPEFKYLVIEKSSPFVMASYVNGVESLKAAYIEFRHGLEKYKWCKDNDSWPGYDNETTAVEEFYFGN